MFRHPNVIAACILSVGLLLSASMICIFIHGLDSTLESKPLVGYGSNVSFPDHLNLYSGNSSFRVALTNDTSGPLIVQQKP